MPNDISIQFSSNSQKAQNIVKTPSSGYVLYSYITVKSLDKDMRK